MYFFRAVESGNVRCVNVLSSGLEKRKEPRNASYISAIIRILPTGQEIGGHIVELASQGMTVGSPQYLEPGAAVAVTYRGVLLLSEVVYCYKSGGEYRVGMKVDHALASGDLTVREAETEIRFITTACTTENVLVPAQARSRAAGL